MVECTNTGNSRGVLQRLEQTGKSHQYLCIDFALRHAFFCYAMGQGKEMETPHGERDKAHDPLCALCMKLRTGKSPSMREGSRRTHCGGTTVNNIVPC